MATVLPARGAYSILYIVSKLFESRYFRNNFKLLATKLDVAMTFENANSIRVALTVIDRK